MRTQLLIAAAVGAAVLAAPAIAQADTGTIQHQRFSENPAVVGDYITAVTVGEGHGRPTTVTVTMVTEGIIAAGGGQDLTCTFRGRTWPTDSTCVFHRVRRGQTWRMTAGGVVNPDHPEYIAAGVSAVTRRGSSSAYCQDPVAGHVATWLAEQHYPCR